LGLEPWRSADAVEAELVADFLPTDGKGLNRLGWPFAVPDYPRPIGFEMRALTLADRAMVAGTAGSQRTCFRGRRSFMLLRVGPPRRNNPRTDGERASG
jgi:hypothetical protein